MQGKWFASAEREVLAAFLSSVCLGQLEQFHIVSCQEVE